MLLDAVDELVLKGAITPQLAMKIMANFDVAIMEALADRSRVVEARLTFKVSLP